MSIPGTNYLIRDHHGLLLAGRLAVCNSSNQTFDVLNVEAVDGLGGFRCPACSGRHDPRRAPTGPVARRMGYTLLVARRQATPTGGAR